MNKYLPKIFLLLIIGLLIVPQISFAAWWNPFTWKIFNKAKAPQTEMQKTNQPSEIEKLKNEIETLKSKTNTATPTSPKISTPTSNTNKSAAQSTISNVKLSNSQIIVKIKPAVVYIETQGGVGSGMIFSTDGYILTNAHVVKGYTNADISISTGKTLSGKVVGRDEETDLAVVKISSEQSLPKVSFGDSTKTEQGDEVFALGFPFGIKGDVSFKEGTISRRIEEYFETSAEIHPGNSGGPLVNRYGQVIGVNTAIFGKSISGIQLGETIKLAIPINTAKNLIADLKAGRNIIVESQEKKQTKQEATNKSTCLAESEKYYNGLVSKLQQLASNDTSLQTILSQINNEIESIKRDRDYQVADITSKWNGYISNIRSIAESRIQAIGVSAMRIGRNVSDEPWASQISSINETLSRDVASYESQKQALVSQVQISSNAQIQKYEDLKTKATNTREKSNQKAMEDAKTEKAVYYNECINK